MEPSVTQMLKIINVARENPQYFLPLLKKQLDSFVTEKEISISPEIIYQTQEGKTLWLQTYQFLSRQQPLPKLDYHVGLGQSAKDHALDMSLTGIFQHKGSDGSSFSDRIMRYCRKSSGAMAEIIGADFNLPNRNIGQLTVLGLIIDDGVYTRGHRKTIFNPQYKYVGCCSKIQGQKIITVFNLTQNKLSLIHEAETKNKRNESQKMNISYPRDNYHKFSETREKSISPFKQINVNTAPTAYKTYETSKQKHTQTNKTSKSPFKQGNRTLKQKIQNVRTFYEEGNKVQQITTKLIYSDGSIEQNTSKHTFYS